MARRCAVVGFMLLVTVAWVARGQETTGAVFGVVSSQDEVPLPGVTVRVSNPDTGFSRAVISNDRGEYRFLALPPARYVVLASLDGFQASRREVEVGLGLTLKVDIELALGAVSATIEVTGEVPLIDVTSTVVGMRVDVNELAGRVPVGREATQVALLAAGTVEGDSEFDGRTPGQRLASVSGASVAENSYLVNGLNITDFRNMLGSSRVPFSFLEEVQVKTGGYEAEFGRSTGGVINMVTKSGGNTMHGGLELFFEPEGLQEQEPSTAVRPNQLQEHELTEVSASLGGAIIRDRLFYFAFAAYEEAESTELWGFTGPIGTDRLERSDPYWGGKLDWYISPGHRLEGTFLSDRVDVDTTVSDWDRDSETLVLAGHSVSRRGGRNAILKYSGLLTEDVLLSFQAGRNELEQTERSDGDECPVAADFRGDYPARLGCWVNSMRGEGRDIRTAYRLDLDYVAGHHSLRAGIDLERNESRDHHDGSGGVGYFYYLNGDRFPELPPETELVNVSHRGYGGTFDVISSAAYVQDSWTVTPGLTLNLGLRWEAYDNRNGLGETFIETDDQYAPRLGAVWDPSGRGRSRVYASFGVYHLPIASNTNVRYASATYIDFGYWVLEGGINPDGSPVGLGDQLSFTVTADGEVVDMREATQSNFEPMSQNEYILGFERALGDAWSIGVRGLAREFNEVIEDFSIDRGLAEAYGIEVGDPVWRLGNPGSDFEGWYDLDSDGVLDRISLSSEQLGFPTAQRSYYALELTFARRFAEGWMVQGSYTWSHLYGNYEGYTLSDIGQSDPGLTQTFDFPALMDHSSGDLFNDRRHNLKIFGNYVWEWGLQLGGHLYYHSGRPVNSFGLHPSDEDAQSYGADSFYTDGEPRPRGCCGTTDDVWGLDVMARYGFRLAGVDMSVRLDVFNLFDNDAVTAVGEWAERNNGEPEPTYGLVRSHQTPRRVRLGLGMSF